LIIGSLSHEICSQIFTDVSEDRAASVFVAELGLLFLLAGGERSFLLIAGKYRPCRIWGSHSGGSPLKVIRRFWGIYCLRDQCPRIISGSACHQLSRWFLAWIILIPWRWRRCIPPKRWLSFNGLHGVMSHKTVVFKDLPDYIALHRRRSSHFRRQQSWVPEVSHFYFLIHVEYMIQYCDRENDRFWDIGRLIGFELPWIQKVGLICCRYVRLCPLLVPAERWDGFYSYSVCKSSYFVILCSMNMNSAAAKLGAFRQASKRKMAIFSNNFLIISIKYQKLHRSDISEDNAKREISIWSKTAYPLGRIPFLFDNQ
jgi:hypothetical protein